MITQLTSHAMQEIAGGCGTSITNELPIPLINEDKCFNTILIRNICDYMPCPSRPWIYI